MQVEYFWCINTLIIRPNSIFREKFRKDTKEGSKENH